jgi:hypothetical protein
VKTVERGAKVGQSVEILGQGFLGATKILFRGTPANFNVLSDTCLQATVPAGAVSGVVTVSTSTEILRSSQPFRVLP